MRKKRFIKSTGRSKIAGKQHAHERQLAARRERDRARRQTKRTAEVWAMPADEVIAKCRAERQKVDGEIESILAEIEGLLK